FSATIAWGDGASTAGRVVRGGSSVYTVLGTHQYADEGPYHITVTVSEDGVSAAGGPAAAIAEAPAFPGDPNLSFLDECYRNVFGRALDDLGRATWGGMLAAGVDRLTAVQLIEQTGEFRADFPAIEVRGLFRALLGRDA